MSVPYSVARQVAVLVVPRFQTADVFFAISIMHFGCKTNELQPRLNIVWQSLNHLLHRNHEWPAPCQLAGQHSIASLMASATYRHLATAGRTEPGECKHAQGLGLAGWSGWHCRLEVRQGTGRMCCAGKVVWACVAAPAWMPINQLTWQAPQ